MRRQFDSYKSLRSCASNPLVVDKNLFTNRKRYKE